MLISKGHQISGYVIMPNHVHALVALNNSEQSINNVLGNGKRFMAYSLIHRLRKDNRSDVLALLSEGVTKKESAKGQLHRAFETSRDIKPCHSQRFIEQKLDYIHKIRATRSGTLWRTPSIKGTASWGYMPTWAVTAFPPSSLQAAILEDWSIELG